MSLISKAFAPDGIFGMDNYGTHTGVSVASTTSDAVAYLQGIKRPPSCPLYSFGPQGAVNVQVPTYFFSPSAKQTGTPSACVQAGYTGYFIGVSYFVADANSSRVSISGMAPERIWETGLVGTMLMPLPLRPRVTGALMIRRLAPATARPFITAKLDLPNLSG
jgi:hypothetical protein